MLTQLKRARPQYAVVALLALLMLQVSWASHESQHVSSDLAEPCFVCVHLDAGHAITPSIELGIFVSPTMSSAPVLQSTFLVTPLHALQPARAPPPFLI